MYRIFPHFTANPLQVSAYLGGIALFSISFLVFINASISFVITDVIGQKSGVGNAVGTLGFADELVALVACPLWGLVSDRIGVRWVAVAGYCVIGLSLICLVQSAHVYPDLIIWRMVFSIGGAACTTMVTAILPTMTAPREEQLPQEVDARPSTGQSSQADMSGNRNSFAPSEASDMTITPANFKRHRVSSPLLARYRRSRRSAPNPERTTDDTDSHMDANRLAGFVGMFTGIGALLALAAFLPLPTVLGKDISKALAVQRSFYIVGAAALLVAIFVSLGLRGLPGEAHKSLKHLFRYSTLTTIKPTNSASTPSPANTYLDLFTSALRLGITDPNICLGYMGGFVARASSVGISLFIPLSVNAYFIRTGECTSAPGAVLRDSCSRAYALASMLTGISQLVALLSAPLYGFFAARLARRPLASRVPLALSAVAGIAGSSLFGALRSPDPKTPQGKTAILAVVLLGAAQIGAIVCSLGLLAQGIQTADGKAGDAAPLLHRPAADRNRLKGSIAGVYSLAGGAAILLLTKLGGHLFDTVDPGAPFYLLAGFNGLLLVAVVVVAGLEAVKRKRDGNEVDEEADDEE